MIWRVLLLFSLVMGLTSLFFNQARQDDLTDSVSFAFFRTNTLGEQILWHIKLTGQKNLIMRNSIDQPIINFEWTKDGQWLLVTLGNWEDDTVDVYLVRADGQEKRLIYQTAYITVGAQYSPDQSHIALIRQGFGNAYETGYLIILDAAGTEISRYSIGDIEVEGNRGWEMMWLNNQTIQVSTDPFMEAYQVDVDQEIIVPIEADEVSGPRNLNDSPDGRWTLEANYHAHDMGLMLHDRQAMPEAEPVMIHEFKGFLMLYTWSADSQWILVSVHGPPLPTGYGGPGELYMVDVAGQESRYLLDDSYFKGWLPFAYSSYASALHHTSYPFSINNEWLAFLEYENLPTANPDVIDAKLHVINTQNPDYQIKNLASGRILHGHIDWAPIPPSVPSHTVELLVLSLGLWGASLGLNFWQKRRYIA